MRVRWSGKPAQRYGFNIRSVYHRSTGAFYSLSPFDSKTVIRTWVYKGRINQKALNYFKFRYSDHYKIWTQKWLKEVIYQKWDWVVEEETFLFIFSFLKWSMCIIFINKENTGRISYVLLASASFSSPSLICTKLLWTILNLHPWL